MALLILLLIVACSIYAGMRLERGARTAIIAIDKPFDAPEDEDEVDADHLKRAFRASGMRAPVVFFTRGARVALLHRED
jgi:hypothetical protein